MAAKPDGWRPLPLFGHDELPFLGMRCNEPLSYHGRRVARLRYDHKHGWALLRVRNPITGEWREVAIEEWNDADFELGILIGGPRRVSLGMAEVYVVKLKDLPPSEQRIQLLREAWRYAGSPAGWTAPQARRAALGLHLEARTVLMAVGSRQLRRDFSSAKADKKTGKVG